MVVSALIVESFSERIDVVRCAIFCTNRTMFAQQMHLSALYQRFFVGLCVKLEADGVDLPCHSPKMIENFFQ